MSAIKNTFTYNHTVTKDEIDTLNHVNNVIYVQWIQEISAKHWQDLTNNELDAKYIWVVTKHEIEYKKQACLGDELTFKTWVGKTKGATSIRHIEIYRKDILLVKAQSIWCMLDAKTLRPARITKNVMSKLYDCKGKTN